MKISFFVPGIPAPGGSKKAFAYVGKDGRPHANVVDDAKGNKPWRDRVASTCREHYHGQPLRGPLRLSIVFLMPRPKGHYGTGRNREKLKPSAPQWHISKPDRTKLLRSLEDSLKGILWADDAQVVEGPVAKKYGHKPGAWVEVEAMEGET